MAPERAKFWMLVVTFVVIAAIGIAWLAYFLRA